MIYLVELKTKVEGARVTHCNEFNGKYMLKENIQEWIFEVRKEYGFRELIIDKVTINNEDLTGEYIKRRRGIVPPDGIH